jgi:hypothetical protein
MGAPSPKTIYRVYSEWDIDHQDVVFDTEEQALQWLEKNTHLQEMICSDDTEFTSVQDIIDDCLVGFVQVRYYREVP